ncbi:U3 small nucleolar ribonucleoprotein complex, subunit Mpp10 [Sesbania bispinosa]|nr:U3 small nucleolar ribonucleoprotein complex, subunit Mpp10 [Sesbania bispinosa]
MANASDAGAEALRRLKATDPPSWLAPNSSLSETARAASQYLFSSLRPFSQKSPLDHLLVDGFDAEQIWQQIDLQSQPLLSTLRRRLKQLAKNPQEISQLKVPSEGVIKAEAKKREEWNEESDEVMENARYEDFFGGKKEKGSKRKAQLLQESEDSGAASTHEKELKKIQSEIEQMEKANIEPKTWTMQGEVTAAKRPKNSALEVDLDFEHNVRPAPVITEEVTASIEDMIRKRITEGHFNDVQRTPKLPSKAPREVKELDDNKSKQGLAEIYEQEYVQKTDPTSAPLSFKDEQKNEASMLFKRLCLKLDALSHFNFAPKPVIEDMSFQANVPALAMEEIAPVAISDAAMLAPEEVFDGKGDIKEEAELTKEERKRRRANKKRKFKAEVAKKTERKAREGAVASQVNGGCPC